MTISRRDLLLGGAGLAAGAAGMSLLGSGPARAQSALKFTPEPGASLRVLRWSPFVKGDEDSWLANTKKFTELTGVEVRIDKESWEDIRPKAAVAANVGSGPDIMWVWFDDAHQYPDKLLDVTDLPTTWPRATVAGMPAPRAMPSVTGGSSAFRSPPSATPSAIARAG